MKNPNILILVFLIFSFSPVWANGSYDISEDDLVFMERQEVYDFLITSGKISFFKTIGKINETTYSALEKPFNGTRDVQVFKNGEKSKNFSGKWWVNKKAQRCFKHKKKGNLCAKIGKSQDGKYYLWSEKRGAIFELRLDE